MTTPLRVLLADDERPARELLKELLLAEADVEVVAEAEDGRTALERVELTAPDLALLDLQMPELGGLEVARALGTETAPLVAFVTAYDEHAIAAFEVNAIDYLLKPVEPARLRATLARARQILARPAWREEQAARLETMAAPPAPPPGGWLERIPVRRREEVLLVPIEHVSSVVADGELLQLTTARGERHVVSYRLKDLEAQLDPARFVRLSRGTLANVRMIVKLSAMPGGTWLAVLANGQELAVSRAQARLLRPRLLQLP